MPIQTGNDICKMEHRESGDLEAWEKLQNGDTVLTFSLIKKTSIFGTKMDPFSAFSFSYSALQ